MERNLMKEVVQYEAFDSSIFATSFECASYETLKGWRTCPVCKGKGTIASDPIYSHSHEDNPTGDMFFRGNITKVLEGYKEIKCKVCQGNGGSLKGFTPLMQVTGFKENI